MPENILQYESTIWNTADLLRGCGIKESEWPSYMMPFFALSMIESRLLRSLDELMAHPKRTADAKAKAAQYFTILNRIEYVIALDKKYSEPAFLAFYRKFNTIYNVLHRVDTAKDPIEVYYDSRIGIVEVETAETKAREPKEPKLAEGGDPYAGGRQLSILAIIEARNQHEEEIGARIAEFKAKMDEFFAYVRTSPEGQRLIVKIKSRLPEDEIYADFAKIYRKYKAFNRKKVGDYFFAVIRLAATSCAIMFDEDGQQRYAITVTSSRQD